MLVAYIAALLAGIALAARVMLAGVLHPPSEGERAESMPARRTRLSPALGAAGATMFGIVGAVLSKLAVAGAGMRFVVALLAAGVAVGGAGLVLKLWALNPGAPPDPEDDLLHKLQGFPAKVTRAVPAGGVGEIAFRYDRVPHVVPARSIDGAQLPLGADVVIDRIEDGSAWVESWAQVEDRL